MPAPKRAMRSASKSKTTRRAVPKTSFKAAGKSTRKLGRSTFDAKTGKTLKKLRGLSSLQKARPTRKQKPMGIRRPSNVTRRK